MKDQLHRAVRAAMDLAIPSARSLRVVACLAAMGLGTEAGADALFPTRSFAAGLTTISVAAADLDGDSLLDLFTANFGTSSVGEPRKTRRRDRPAAPFRLFGCCFLLSSLLLVAGDRAASAWDVAAAADHTCVIDDICLFCWGNDDVGQLDAPALSNPIHLPAGRKHSCAIDDDGVACWGLNDQGETDVPPGLVNPFSVSAGSFHTCVIDDNGIACWGSDESGQLRVPRDLVFAVAPVPTTLPSLSLRLQSLLAGSRLVVGLLLGPKGRAPWTG